MISRNSSLCSNNKKNPFKIFLEYQPQNVENNIAGSQKQSLDEENVNNSTPEFHCMLHLVTRALTNLHKKLFTDHKITTHV